jgi:hypothetical protein
LELEGIFRVVEIPKQSGQKPVFPFMNDISVPWIAQRARFK